jgi:hypothetical protein
MEIAAALALAASIASFAVALRSRAKVDAGLKAPPRDVFDGLETWSFEGERAKRIDLPGLRLTLDTVFGAKGAEPDSRLSVILVAGRLTKLELLTPGKPLRFGDYVIIVDSAGETSNAATNDPIQWFKGRAAFVGQGDPASAERRVAAFTRRRAPTHVSPPSEQFVRPELRGSPLQTQYSTRFQGLTIFPMQYHPDLSPPAVRLTMVYSNSKSEMQIPVGESADFEHFRIFVESADAGEPYLTPDIMELTIRSIDPESPSEGMPPR